MKPVEWDVAGQEEALGSITDAIESAGSPTIAIVSAPFGGREAFMDYAASHYEDRQVERISLDSLTISPRSFKLEEADVLFVDDCHYLFRRRIGGFDRLESFLEQAVGANTTVVTSWNAYAWQYMQQAKRIDQMFSHTIEVPILDTEGISAFLKSMFDDDTISFVDDRDREEALSRGHAQLSILGRWTPTIPYPKVNLSAVDTDDLKPEEAVFKRIKDRSEGLPGVAKAVWEASLEERTISPNRIVDSFDDIDIDETTAYALRTVLMNEGVNKSSLQNVIDDTAVPRVIREMQRNDLISVDDTLQLNPLALDAIRKELERRRLLW